MKLNFLFKTNLICISQDKHLSIRVESDKKWYYLEFRARKL